MTELTQEYYGDIFYLRTSPWGVAITFSVAPYKDGVEGHDNCIVRVSHETAKALCMMLRKQLKNYERETETSIDIPNQVMNQLGLAAEDW